MPARGVLAGKMPLGDTRQTPTDRHSSNQCLNSISRAICKYSVRVEDLISVFSRIWLRRDDLRSTEHRVASPNPRSHSLSCSLQFAFYNTFSVYMKKKGR